MAATVLAIPLAGAVMAALALGAYGIAHLRLYGFALFSGGLALVRPAIALIQSARTGRSPTWFEEQDLDDEEIQELRNKHRSGPGLTSA